MNRKRETRAAHAEQLDRLIDDIEAGTTLQNWNSLIEEISCPAEIGIALAAMRPELVALAKPRELTAEEAAGLYRIISVLIRTNYALQKHAEETAKMVNHWAAAFKQLESLGGRINHFANFRRSDNEYVDDAPLSIWERDEF